MDKKKILIVDDEENFGRIMKMNLEQLGKYEVWVETNGADACSAAAVMKPDLILLDVMMPGKNGFAVLEEIKRNRKTMSVPVIMLTSVTDDEAKIKAVEHFCEDYLIKPIMTDALVEKIDGVLKRRSPDAKE